MIKHLLLTLACIFACAHAQAAEPAQADAAYSMKELYATPEGGAWIYLPAETPSKGRIPCVIVPPAGTPMVHGITVGEGDAAEHIPYAKAGFAVVTFDISGPRPDTLELEGLKEAIRAFTKAKCGVADALKALDAALAKHPRIDPDRIYIAGHSSAATLALQVTAASDRIKGCIAYAPVVDIPGSLGPEFLAEVNRMVPGTGKILHANSPSTLAPKIKCPVFLFNALDDSKIAPESIASFKDALSTTNKTVLHTTVKTGDHYDSMIRQGIPMGIVWLKAIDSYASRRKPAASKP